MAKETRLWEWLRNGLRSYGHLVRVENLVVEGTPDVNYAISGCEGWIELKSTAALPARAKTAVFGSAYNLSPAQIEWIVQRCRARGTVFILARAAQTVWLVPGHHATCFNAAASGDLAMLARFQNVGPMAQHRWRDLADALIEKSN